MTKRCRVLFLGDSITAAWTDKGKPTWDSLFLPLDACNMGVNGDCTDDLLRRIDESLLEEFQPEVVVINIGTNNTGHRKDPAEKTASEIQQIVEQILSRFPQTNILLHALFPRARKAQNPLRLLNQQINQLIEPLADNKRIFWLDLSNMFVDENGVIPQTIMHDALHPNANQYPRWGNALLPHILKLLK